LTPTGWTQPITTQQVYNNSVGNLQFSLTYGGTCQQATTPGSTTGTTIGTSLTGGATTTVFSGFVSPATLAAFILKPGMTKATFINLWNALCTNVVTTPPAKIVCGNGKCESGEDSTNCPADCPPGAPKPPAKCGNGTCEAGEDSTNCAVDCASAPPGPTPAPTPLGPIGPLGPLGPPVIAVPAGDADLQQAVANVVNNMPSTPTSIVPIRIDPKLIQTTELAAVIFNQTANPNLDLKALDFKGFVDLSILRAMHEMAHATSNHYYEDAKVVSNYRGDLYPEDLLATRVPCQVDEDCARELAYMDWTCKENYCSLDDSALVVEES
jgi:hypothetical protein